MYVYVCVCMRERQSVLVVWVSVSISVSIFICIISETKVPQTVLTILPVLQCGIFCFTLLDSIINYTLLFH